MIKQAIKNRWQGAGGMKEVLVMALPLIISTSAHSIQLFIDRAFLMKISPDAMSASMQSGLCSFTFIAFFFGIVSYSNTFVAQYSGAKRSDRIGPAVWQAIHLALLGGIIILALYPFAARLTALFDHGGQLAIYETIYFQWMCIGAPLSAAEKIIFPVSNRQ